MHTPFQFGPPRPRQPNFARTVALALDHLFGPIIRAVIERERQSQDLAKMLGLPAPPPGTQLGIPSPPEGTDDAAAIPPGIAQTQQPLTQMPAGQQQAGQLPQPNQPGQPPQLLGIPGLQPQPPQPPGQPGVRDQIAQMLKF